jgi:riboflavin kinase/FMN adenylyltransferase
MKLIEDLNQIVTPYHKGVITIGNFDGVHIGHQALFHQVIEQADAIGGTSIAMTFEPHPIRVLHKSGNPPLITLYDQKIELIARSGIDVLICVPFTQEFASITAQDYVEDILLKRIGVSMVVVGGDYTFGRNREGNLELLKSYADRLGFQVKVLDWITSANGRRERISSTKIRDLVTNGKVADAYKLLGRYYQIRGTVMAGRNRGGKLLGFPTANINLHDEICPKTGIYAVTVECLGRKYKGVANIGYSPTFDDHLFTVEVHILDFDERIYDQEIRVNFVKRIRDEKKFASITELADQIKRDVIRARKILSL